MKHNRRKIDAIRAEFERLFMATDSYDSIASSIAYDVFEINPDSFSSVNTLYDGYTNPIVDNAWEVFLINWFRNRVMYER